MKMDSATYMILDMDSGNAVAEFEDQGEAMAALIDMARLQPEIRTDVESLALVTFDKEGEALGASLAADLLPSS